MIVEKFIKKVVTATPFDSLSAIARSMMDHNVGAIVVADNHRPVGIITDRDVALELGAKGTSPLTQATKVMSTPIQTVHQNDVLFAVAEYMKEYQVRRLAVVDDDGWLVGIVTLDDILQVLVRELTNVVAGIQPEMRTK